MPIVISDFVGFGPLGVVAALADDPEPEPSSEPPPHATNVAANAANSRTLMKMRLYVFTATASSV
jgi:hypothetical protein